MKLNVFTYIFIVCIVCGTIFAGSLPAFAALTLDLATDFPQVGTMVTVTLDNSNRDGFEIHRNLVLLIEYRPNSETSSVIEVPSIGPGIWHFTPTTAGLITMKVVVDNPISATTQPRPVLVSRNVSIRYDQPPSTGILVMVIAAFILLGGIACSFWHGMRCADMAYAPMPPIDT